MTDAVLSASLWAGAVATLACSPVFAGEQPSPLAQGLLGAPPATAGAERFATPDGGARFVLDRSGQRVVLVRFEGGKEVLALTPTPGPRGDEFLKTDTGRVLLRVTALGGVILFADGRSGGAPAASEGAAAPLPPPAAPPGGLKARLSSLSKATGRKLGRPVAFEAPPSAPSAAGVVSDAAARAAEGLEAARPVHIRRVVIVYGAKPAARLEADALRVVVAPHLGYAGRPSAAAVKAAAER